MARCYRTSLSSALSAFDSDLENLELSPTPSLMDFESYDNHIMDVDDVSSIITCDADPTALPDSTAETSIEGRYYPMIDLHRDRIDYGGDGQERLLDGLPHQFPITATSLQHIEALKPPRSLYAADPSYYIRIPDGAGDNHAKLDASSSNLSFEDMEVLSIASRCSSLSSPLSARAYSDLEEAEHEDEMAFSPASSISWRS